MDFYTWLAQKMGVTREVAKARAFAYSYGLPSRNGKPVDTEVDRLMKQYHLEDPMTDTLSQSSHLNSLGSEKTEYVYSGVDKKLLETFPNPLAHLPKNAFGEVEIVAPEFTSLCPKTGQPDFAEIYVKYTPRDWCVESKAFKLYLGTFRQAGEFHEACVTRIVNDLVELLDPIQLEVIGRFTPRGGIKFHPRVVYYGRDKDIIDAGKDADF